MISRVTSANRTIRWAQRSRYTICQPCHVIDWPRQHQNVRALQAIASPDKPISFRKQLKDEKATRRAAGDDPAARKCKAEGDLIHWELTVGLEIHAQLQTEHKLFSRAQTSVNVTPNSNVSFFDLAMPGSQPEFQNATLIPALRAAIAFGCQIQRRSTFDRKHYFYQDQPAGYQITQYYHPFATDGTVTLTSDDLIGDEPVIIGIKQIQLEQDTAKTIIQPPSDALLDFNRVGHPLIEIITLPQIHDPRTAAACVKKIQATLQAVNAVKTGMEMGGLRADVNVSVRRRSSGKVEDGLSQYSGITGLGQRTEIKNLSSFQAVEKAIEAERDRQIDVLEAGGKIEGETRGWTLGSTETRKLRGKEGEVDYRYMPDPDLHPLIIGEDLIRRISSTLPELPDQSINSLVEDLGLATKDAMTLVSLDDGDRLDYFDAVFDELASMAQRRSFGAERRKAASTAANWVIHELGGLLSSSETPFRDCKVSSSSMSLIIDRLLKSQITGRSAKKILSMVFDGDSRSVDAIIEEESLTLRGLPDEKYTEMAMQLISDPNNRRMVLDIREKGRMGKLQWFVGQMMRMGKGQVEPGRAESALKNVIGVD